MASDVSGSFSKTLHRVVRDYIFPRKHTALLVAIMAAFAVRPLIGHAQVALVVFSLSFMALLLLALYTIHVDELVGDRDALLAQRRRRSVVGWSLATLAIAERLLMLFAPSPQLSLVGTLTWLVVLSFVTWTELGSVLRQREVTRETISMSISVYLLLGLNWALLYAVIFQLQPHAFRFGESPLPIRGSSPDPLHVLPAFIYFSLITLTTIGYGDITPLTLQARYAALAEGLTGQLYLAILVARLVGMYMARTTRVDTSRPSTVPEADTPPAETGEGTHRHGASGT